ncbi:hypothetical protein M3I54_29750 [Paraburkholderia sp. CNPSo 3274]|uniref:hypothetical protein n=1 Tax=Paraburkholderia sp. CNPSo 3274 TaxID=2940932 RepID=UPI0020B71547|nr:hypothetical protein [Paraburkholderia sp. CNPSo 3274]MCP3711112.1 hypothetical protein [Paraburkholderia sp. CNPSo 3274]
MPFTLPVTDSNWPPRYAGAPDPATASDDALASSDLSESARRLGGLLISATLDAAGQQTKLTDLHGELIRLVEGFPGAALARVPLNDAAAAGNAPALGLTLIQQLLLLAFDPYCARVLGVYFVDSEATAGVDYDYCIAGFWGDTPEAARVLIPGLASAAALALGTAVQDGATITAGSTLPATSLWRWTKDGVPQLDPGAPAVAASPVGIALGGLAPSQQPAALLIALSTGSGVAHAPTVSITIGDAYARIDLQVSGVGIVEAMSGGTTVASATFASTSLTLVTLISANPNTSQIDQIVVSGVSIPSQPVIVVTVGEITLHRLAADPIGTRYAMLHAPHQIAPLVAPGDPVSTYRHRDADVDASSLQLVPRSLIDIEWPAPDPSAALYTGDPVTDPAAIPPPTRPIGFVVERNDTGGSEVQRLSKRVLAAAAATPADSPLTSKRRYRCADASLPDPAGGWRHAVAGFNLFGVLGNFSQWTAPLGVEHIAASPSALSLRGFDNRALAAGAANPPPPQAPLKWTGGTLTAAINWSGGTLAMYPDIRSARLTVESVDLATGNPTGTLVEYDFAVPSPVISAMTVVSATPSDSTGAQIEIETDPPLPAPNPGDPTALLVLTFPDGARERHVVRPEARGPSGGAPVVAVINSGTFSRMGATPQQSIGQTAYLISGCAMQINVAVPLDVPLAQTSARGRFSVTGSTQTPFAPNEMIVDPNGLNAPRGQPASAAVSFSGPQRLVPPTPPTPVHSVHHEYFDRADFTGQASRTLPFDTTATTGTDSFSLYRAPVQSLVLADMKRRLALGNAADANPTVLDSGTPRKDLQAWIGALGAWLDAYNQGNSNRAPSSWTLANVLSDASARRAFGEHFYGGLLDDELRALADLPDNATGFARVNGDPSPLDTPISTSVDGKGFGRTLYTLAAFNNAGTVSARTGSIGPYYTQPSTPPRAPVLYKVQPAVSTAIVAWALDENPDVAAYLVYRAGTTQQLADLRWFGSDPSAPQTTGLSALVIAPTAAAPVSFGAGLVDPRIMALVPHPQICARDYDDSDMGEVPLPAGFIPTQVNAVYRATDYEATRAPLDQPQAFNYWTPPEQGGIAQLVTTANQARITGLRIGLGRRVAVVVVATFDSAPRVLGALLVRRSAFVDGVGADGKPLDAHALSGYTAPDPKGDNAYAMVAVDVYGQRSASSKIFVTRLLTGPA